MELLRLVAPLLVIELILKIVALLDLKKKEPNEVRFGKRWIWVVIILVVSTLGPVGYLLFGRSDSA